MVDREDSQQIPSISYSGETRPSFEVTFCPIVVTQSELADLLNFVGEG